MIDNEGISLTPPATLARVPDLTTGNFTLPGGTPSSVNSLSGTAGEMHMTREERKAAKKARKKQRKAEKKAELRAGGSAT